MGKPNLILFGIDSLRADHMSLYGYSRLTTPHIDKFAAGELFSKNVLAHTFQQRQDIPQCLQGWMSSAPMLLHCDIKEGLVTILRRWLRFSEIMGTTQLALGSVEIQHQGVFRSTWIFLDGVRGKKVEAIRRKI